MLFTGPGGEAWRAAAHQASAATGVEVGATSIGAFCDYEDPYGWWADYAGIDENGA